MSFNPGTGHHRAHRPEVHHRRAGAGRTARRCTTTFNSGTQLTATVDLTEPGNLDLQVLNPAPGPATSADLIATVNGTPPTPIVSPQDAARFLEQATFGATDADIHNVSMNGYQAWLNQQFASPPTPDGARRRAGGHRQQSALRLQRRQVQRWRSLCRTTRTRTWSRSHSGSNRSTAPDELRQRVKYALSPDLRHLQQQHHAHPEHAARRSQLLRHARQRRLRQLPPAPSGRDPEPDDGAVPLHAGQRQGQRHHRSRRELRARSHAAVHHRPLAVERRRLAEARRNRQSHPHLLQYRREGPGRGLHRLQLEHSRRFDTDNAWSNCCVYVGPGLRRRAAAHAELPQPPLHRRKAFSRRHHSRLRQLRTPTAISRSLSTRSSIIPICPRSSPSR